MIGQLANRKHQSDSVSTFSASPHSDLLSPLRLRAAILLVALLITVLSIAALAPAIGNRIQDWTRTTLEDRARLLAGSLRYSVVGIAGRGQVAQLTPLLEAAAAEGGATAIAWCVGGDFRSATRGLPRGMGCERFARAEGERFSIIGAGHDPLLVGTFPVGPETAHGHIVVLQGLAASNARATEVERYALSAIAIIVLGLMLIAGRAMLPYLQRWLAPRERIVTVPVAPPVPPSVPEAREEAGNDPLGAAIRQMLHQLDASRSPIDAQQMEWNAQSLRSTMDSELPNAEVIVVSNREPYIHNRGEDGLPQVQIPASGLVSALEPIMRACGGTWVAHGSGNADRETVDAHDRLQVPPEAPSYTLRRVWLTEDEQDGYYYGFANEGLWPLCHIAFVRPSFRESDWQSYKEINQRFADAVVREARTPNPVVLVQDYHFALLPRMVRAQLPEATIITFWHIPWPNAETFGICPWKEEIIDGLLGSSILGFHTRFHCNNFIETVDRFVESRIDREQVSVLRGGTETLVRSYPISIEWPPAALAKQRPVPECRAEVVQRLRLPSDAKIAVGIERFDYTKGIPERMRAVDAFLTANPRWLGRFVFVQVAAPTRSRLASYQALHEEAAALSREINERHGTATWKPIQLLVRHHGPREVFQLFRAADLCLVSSLHDGMNLVAKEFVAARDDELGVLVLSSFAGASRELSEALIVNPFDAQSMARTIERAISMPQAEQRERMRLMREQVRMRNVYRWAGQMVLDASRLRKKQNIVSMAGQRRRPVLVRVANAGGVRG